MVQRMMGLGVGSGKVMKPLSSDTDDTSLHTYYKRSERTVALTPLAQAPCSPRNRGAWNTVSRPKCSADPKLQPLGASTLEALTRPNP